MLAVLVQFTTKYDCTYRQRSCPACLFKFEKTKCLKYGKRLVRSNKVFSSWQRLDECKAEMPEVMEL